MIANRIIWLTLMMNIRFLQEIQAQTTFSDSEDNIVISSYSIGSGDTIEVIVWAGQMRENTLSGEYFVFATGVIEMPLLGEVALAGKTLEDAGAYIESQLGNQYIRSPQVGLRIKEYGSQIIHVLGAVEKPGSFPMQGQMSLAEALAKAEGADSNIKGAKQVKISRQNGDKIVVDLEKMLRDGTGNVPLKAGDVIYVTEGQYVVVNGKVDTPGNIPWKEGITITEAISLAGGALNTANLREVYLLRGSERIPVNVKKIAKGRLPDVALEQGDRLFVEESVW